MISWAKIDDVKVYSRSLSADEIKKNYISNLYEYDSGKWAFYTNETNLGSGLHTYSASATDIAGNSNMTGTRTLNIASPSVPCGSTLASNTVLSGNLVSSGTCFTIGADNIVLDCNGFSITGNEAGYGITSKLA